uniref:N-acetyltransferase domain-containing protein n=1 Tax=Clastoptera arizonana TaxID=38151 RepID=A0A1B6CJ34_9HEMI
MRKNSNICIVGNKVILVPYRKKHVKKYHFWMQSTELQNLTGSDPLSEEQEYEMQQTWRDDEDKCTFIILDKQIMTENNDEIDAMIGDTNLYLKYEDGFLNAETGIMVAEPKARRCGMGQEAMLLMFHYGVEELNVVKYIAKISMSNVQSLQMFKKFGFETESKSDVFQEVTLVKSVSDEWKEWLNKEIFNIQILKYCDNDE